MRGNSHRNDPKSTDTRRILHLKGTTTHCQQIIKREGGCTLRRIEPRWIRGSSIRSSQYLITSSSPPLVSDSLTKYSFISNNSLSSIGLRDNSTLVTRSTDNRGHHTLSVLHCDVTKYRETMKTNKKDSIKALLRLSFNLSRHTSVRKIPQDSVPLRVQLKIWSKTMNKIPAIIKLNLFFST